MIMKRGMYLGLILMMLLSVVGCRFFGVNTETIAGSLSLTITDMVSSPRIILPPLDMEIAAYDVHGSGPDGASFQAEHTGKATFFWPELDVGIWTISVEGFNDEGTKVGTGACVVSIRPGRTALATVLVEPLSGNGSLYLTVTWPAGVLSNPFVIGMLQPAGGTAVELAFERSLDGLSASCAIGAMAVGYYVVGIAVQENGATVCGCTETVRVLANTATSGVFACQADDSDPTAGLLVDTSPLSEDPIEISLTGVQQVLPWGVNMEVTASPSTSVESFQWWLDGQVLLAKAESSITFGAELRKGNHRLDLVVTRESMMSAEGVAFCVKPVMIRDLLPQVQESQIYNTALDLQNFVTRKFETSNNFEAGSYLYDRLAAIANLEVEYENGVYRNVVATLPGTRSESEGVLIVGAHYDSTSTDPANAPGAMDNGCGVGILLELARIMSKYRFERTVKYACWNTEEGSPNYNVSGSIQYASNAYLESANILLYFNLDTVAYDPDGSLVLDVIYNDVSEWAKDLVVQHNELYGIGFSSLTFNVNTSCSSDHKPFWNYGFSAVTGHSQTHGPTHEVNDTVEKISLDFAKRNGQLALSLLADLASE